MAVKFRCTLSGNCVSFEAPHEIAELRSHPQYVEVFEDGSESVEKSDMDRPPKRFKRPPVAPVKKS